MKRACGFTMFELLIALAIVAILAAIAIPSYQTYVVRGQRASARAVLLQTSQMMERFYTDNGAYPTAGNGPMTPILGTASCVAVAPMDSNLTTYCISGANTATGGFLLTATPCGDNPGACPAAANGSFTDAQCDQLTIDNTGLKQAVVGGAAASATVDSQCWQQ